MNTFVSFELAKLLKEKDFNLPAYKSYRISVNPEQPIAKEPITDENTYFPNVKESYSAPTIAEVVMWLYDNHGIWIIVSYEDTAPSKEWYWSALKHGEDRAYQYYKFNSPTNAYEAAIEYALNNLV